MSPTEKGSAAIFATFPSFAFLKNGFMCTTLLQNGFEKVFPKKYCFNYKLGCEGPFIYLFFKGVASSKNKHNTFKGVVKNGLLAP